MTNAFGELISDLRRIRPDLMRSKIDRAFAASRINMTERNMLQVLVLRKEGRIAEAIQAAKAVLRADHHALFMWIELARMHFDRNEAVEGIEAAHSCLVLSQQRQNEAFVVESTILLAVAKAKWDLAKVAVDISCVPDGYSINVSGEWWARSGGTVIRVEPPWKRGT
jgi:hypothetical protein